MSKLLLLLFCSFALEAQSSGVLAILSAREGVSREQIMKWMPAEIKATVQLHLDGKIRQWYSKEDGKGVVFILDSKSVAEAKATMETLPLMREKLATIDYIGLSPLSPLKLLLQ